MADDELFGLDDDLPAWAFEDVHDIPVDNADEAEQPAEGTRIEDSPSPSAPVGRAVAGLPAGVTLLPEGAIRFYSQRVTAPPMVDCMFAALCTPLSYMGYGLPAHFVATLRDASGVPRFDASGRPQGTNTAASRKALRKLLPESRVIFGGIDDTELLTRLAAGQIAARVMVSSQELPVRLRRFIGRNWRGLHAIALGGARQRPGGAWEVRWMDPAARPGSGYDGEFVAYSDIRPALRRTPTGRVRVTFGHRDAALPASSSLSTPEQSEDAEVRFLTNGRHDEFASIPRGTPFLHPETAEQVTAATEDADFRLAGRSVDGRYAGVWVNTSRVRNATGLTLLLVETNRIGAPFIRA